MTLQDWGALGELLGGFAVLATLVYLARQIRQNTAMITAQAVQASVDATQRVLLFRAEHPHMRAILRKARSGEEMSTDEFEVMVSYLQAAFMNFQARLQHNTRGVFDASVNESYELILTDYLQQEYVRRWWTRARSLYGRDFRIHVDELVKRIETGGVDPLLEWSDIRIRDVQQGAQRTPPDDRANAD